eukprot:Nk52_evm1s1482 gene=Nk52_evmTU1s1482
MDVYSGYTLYLPARDQSGSETARLLWQHWFTRFGFPETIHSDQGPGFMSKMHTTWTKILGIVQPFSAPHMPRGHGAIENRNKQLDTQMRKVKTALDSKINKDLSQTKLYQTKNNSKSPVPNYADTDSYTLL